MSKVDNNISYIFIPFKYSGKKVFAKYFKPSNSNFFLEKESVSQSLFLNYVDAVFDNADIYSMSIPSSDTKTKIICFDTGVGFIIRICETSCREDDSILSHDEHVKKFNANILDLSDDVICFIRNNFDKISLFPTGANTTIIYSILMCKAVVRDNISIIPDIEEHEFSKVDRLHKYRCFADNVCVLTDQYYSNFSEDEIQREQLFRDEFEQAVLLLISEVYHEKQMVLILRENVIRDKKNSRSEIRDIKKKILDLISCYSFKTVSEDSFIEGFYETYRETVDINDYEVTLSDLASKLEEELQRKSDKRFNWISFLIALFGIVSIILDILTYYKTFIEGV